MNYFSLAFKVSRFRFWLYLGGTFVIGYILGLPEITLTTFVTPQFILFFLFFMLPANIYLYGINDYFDTDTDEFNTKKDEKEIRIQENTQTKLRNILLVMIAIFVVYLFINFYL